MELERGRVIEIVVSVAVVAAFVIVLVGIGLRYNRGNLEGAGGLALVGAIALFIIVMGIVGVFLAYVLNE